MKLSIIIPSFNSAEYLEATLQSVINQSGGFELIVIDGGSTDGTLKLLEKYSDKLTWISESDQGQSDAINKGFKKATGDVLAFLNADDLYQPGALAKVSQFFIRNPDQYWLTGFCQIINSEGQSIRNWITKYKNWHLRRYSYNKLLAENFISQPATFWRREVYEKYGEMDLKHHLVMDYEYWLRIGQKYPLTVLPEYLASFRWYPASKSGANYKQQFREELVVAKQYAGTQKWPIIKHQFNLWKIVGVYGIMEKLRILPRNL